MLTSDIIATKEQIKDLRRTVEYQNSQIQAIKSLSGERNSAETSQVLNKEKQKNTVLFMQVVRLGDTVEKMNDYLSSVARSTESKYN